MLYDLAFDAHRVRLGDLHGLFPRLPAEAIARGDVAIRSRNADVLELRFADLSVAYHGGTLAGEATVVLGPRPAKVALRDVDLASTEFDLEFVRPFLDTLPIAGRLTGHARAMGWLDSLGVEVDWAFRDTTVAGQPVTRLRARGAVSVGGGPPTASRSGR